MKKKDYSPNKAYLWSGGWLGIYNRLKGRKGKSVRVKLETTPGLYGIDGNPEEREWCMCLEKEARIGDDGNIHLSVLSDVNMGDEYGFGVEPDEYLVGTVSPMGTIIMPLHIE